MAIFLAALQVLGGAVGELAIWPGLLLAGALAFGGGGQAVVPLVILSFPAVGIARADEGAVVGEFWAGLRASPVSDVSFVGVQLNAPLVTAGAAGLRLAAAFLRGTNKLGELLPRWTYFGWFLSFLPALLGAWEGFEARNNRWSIGVRAVLTVGGFFWGYQLGQLCPRPYFARKLIRGMAVAGALLSVSGLLTGHLQFILAGLVAPLAVDALLGRRWLLAACAAAPAVLFVSEGTFTLSGSVVLSCALALGSRLNDRVRGLALAALATGLLATTALLFARAMTTDGEPRSESGVWSSVGQLRGGAGEGMSFEDKLMSDRSPLWRAALEQVLGGPYLVVPAGRPVLVYDYGREGVVPWENGAHNFALEVLAQTGVVTGFLLVALVVFAVAACLALAWRRGTADERTAAAGLTAVAIVGSLTGNFPMGESVGFLLWALIGGVTSQTQHKRVESSPAHFVGAAPDAGSKSDRERL